MKHIKLTAVLLCLFAAPLSAIGTAEDTKTIPQAAFKDSSVLVAYFSLVDIVPEGADAVSHATPVTGNTETAAAVIAELTGGDLFAIRTEQSYPVSHSAASAVAEDEMRRDARPALSTHLDDLDGYDVIFLGYPIWWYIEPMAIRTFLEEYDFAGKTIIPFCTSLGAGVGRSEDNIAALVPSAAVVEGITLRTGRDSQSQIEAWLDELGII